MSELWHEAKLGWKYKNYPLLITLALVGILLCKIFVFIGRRFYLFWAGVPFDVFLQVATFYGVLAFYMVKSLPPRDFWDPNHKLLHPTATPTRPNTWDKFAVQCLGRLGLLSSQNSPPLPPEIWKMIIDMVVDVPYVFDTCCDSKDFHRFINTFSESSPESIRVYALSEVERKNLRLVCKAWAELAPRPGRWLFHARHLIDVKVKRLNLSIYEPQTTIPDLHSGNHLSTMSIHIFPFEESLEESIQPILKQIHSIPSIRTFSFTNKDVSLQLSLRELQAQFTSLTTLYIETVELYGPLQLDKLEVLYWNVERCDKDQWWFPSLRHCALGDRVIGVNKFQSSHVPGPTHQIQSLYFPKQGPWITLDDAFWKDFPCLEYLGVYNHMAEIIQPGAPSHHPLRHISFNDTAKEDINVYNFLGLTSLVPNLRRITLPPTFGQESSKALHETCLFLFQEHYKRGIDWVDKEGNLIFYHRLVTYGEWSLYIHLVPLFCGIYSWTSFSMWIMTTKESTFLSPFQLPVSVLLLLFYIILAAIRLYECYISPNYMWTRSQTSTSKDNWISAP
ncbi:hypothetical protein CPB86DRAFT_779829 [Serendipita vermifera]|nr:hypothetical protein CPB86DRAFT_779829 [Serendipita vermifera]